MAEGALVGDAVDCAVYGVLIGDASTQYRLQEDSQGSCRFSYEKA